MVQREPALSYDVLSITKLITTVAIRQLLKAGKLDPDAPIQRCAPTFPESRRPVTPRQLLTHHLRGSGRTRLARHRAPDTPRRSPKRSNRRHGARCWTTPRNRVLDIRAGLELVAKVWDAVNHADQRGIPHRDLNPAAISVVRARIVVSVFQSAADPLFSFEKLQRLSTRMLR
jgi:hypothetical protein